MELKKWFFHNVKLPILFILGLGLVINIIFSFYLFFTDRRVLETRLNNISDLISVSIYSKDRVSIETSINIMASSFNVSEALICQKEKVLISSFSKRLICINEKNVPWYQTVISRGIEGNADYRLLIILDYFLFFSRHVAIVLILILSCLGIFIWVKNVEKKVNEELLHPLKNPLALKSNKIFEIDKIINNFKKTIQIETEKAKYKKAYNISRKVAHDIRSPLSALEIIIKSSHELNQEKKDILREASLRIQNIASDLLKNKASNRDHNQRDYISHLNETDLITTNSKELEKSIKSLIEIKSIEYGDLKINFCSKIDMELNVIADLRQLERIISNLINNSKEASEGVCNVTLDIYVEGKTFFLEIRDNGRGMSKDIQAKIFKEGFSFGKVDGNGIGLFYAKNMIESWGGNISFSSIEGRGTKFYLKLKLA